MNQLNEIVSQFVKTNRAQVAANRPEEWQPALQNLGEVLDQIETVVKPISQAGQATDNARLFSMLLTTMAETGQYRHEQFLPASQEDDSKRTVIDQTLLPQAGKLRQKAIGIAKQYLQTELFNPLHHDIVEEIFPLLDTMDPDLDPQRFMPFRVIQVGNIVERLYGFRVRITDSVLIGTDRQAGLLREIYDRKYLRFGTSGVRGRWQYDFTETRAKQVTQAVCEFLKAQNIPAYVGAEDLSGKRIVIGYDSRKNARVVADWVMQVCLANGFVVDIANRDTPTPALVYYLTDYLPPEEVAGLINCTASHNPPEWQGIKFNPRLGYPAPTNVTDFIAFRINEMQLLNQGAQTIALENVEERGVVRGFDPITDYTHWIFSNGQGNGRIPIDFEAIRAFFADKFVIIDEMHGAGRGYLTRLLGEIGVRHTVLHAQRDPNIPGLDYANPEEPFNHELVEAVRESGAFMGMGLDTDADRYGVVDQGGKYIRPNQILPMLVRYLGVERKLNGRVIATQTGSPLNEVLAGMIPGNEAYYPAPGAVPPYIRHPFYRLRVGSKEGRAQKFSFLVPVGIKYIEEIRRVDPAYGGQKKLPDNWRDVLLIGGEESSGLTSRGHVTDKDGMWANLLIMDMLAYYAKKTSGRVATLAAIWDETVNLPGCWRSYGGKELDGSNTGRVDIDAVLEAKEAFIDYFLNYTAGGVSEFADLEIVYLGGTRYDIAEIQLRDASGNDQHFLRVRASGTEPINRVYLESSDPVIAQRLMHSALSVLEKLSIEQAHLAASRWRLVDVLCQTRPGQALAQSVKLVIIERGWQASEIIAMIHTMLPTLENRTRKIALAWVKLLVE